MLKSQILKKLQKKHNNLSDEDIEQLFNIFIKEELSNTNIFELFFFISSRVKFLKQKNLDAFEQLATSINILLR